MEKLIREIVKEAMRAPSGDNMQPWRFELHDNILEVYNIPGRDASLYNWNEYGSLIAIGALIENISLLSPFFEMECIPVVHNLEKNDVHIATLSFSKKRHTSPHQAMRSAIARRSTNRKPYANTILPAKVVEEIGEVFAGDSQFSLHLFTDAETRKNLAQAAAQNESVLFGNKGLHNFFFSHIQWKGEKGINSVHTSYGFPEATLEIPKKGKYVFKALRSWGIASIFRKLRLTTLIVRDNAKLYATGAAIGVFAHKGEAPPTLREYVLLGMQFERIWLILGREGYWLQPLFGIITLARRIKEGGGGLSSSEAKIILDASDRISQITHIAPENAIGMFRVGNAEQPTEMTEREPANIIILNHQT